MENILSKPGHAEQEKDGVERVSLYGGAQLLYSELAPYSPAEIGPAAGDILHISYCRTGRLEWESENDGTVYLNPGDFCVGSMRVRGARAARASTEGFSGLCVLLDLRWEGVPLPTEDEDISGVLRERFCREEGPAFFAGNKQTEDIFSGFYSKAEFLRQTYLTIKLLELIVFLCRMDLNENGRLTAYRSDQLELIREIHDSLTERMSERVTIDELARRYLINPTTLKTAFKSVYGSSIAAHIKEHRMEYSAKLLRESDRSVAEIAREVGYDSQSRFSAAFKDFFGVLPREYRRGRRNPDAEARDGCGAGEHL